MGTTSVSSYCRSISSRHEAHKVWFNNPASFRYYHSSIRRGFDRYHPAAWRCLDFGPCRLCLQTGSSRPVLSIERTRGTDPSDFPAALTHQRSIIHPVGLSWQGKIIGIAIQVSSLLCQCSLASTLSYGEQILPIMQLGTLKNVKPLCQWRRPESGRIMDLNSIVTYAMLY